MNKHFTLKKYGFAFLFMLGTFFSYACLNDMTIEALSTIDNGNGTCTYQIEISISHTNAAVNVQMTAIGGTFDNCDGGSCSNIPLDNDNLTVFTATLTKNCDDEILIYARAQDNTNFECGVLGVRFSGEETGLPAELVAFEGDSKASFNILSWKTASEENTLAFLIQRSINGINGFETIGRVDAAGNSTESLNYDFKDRSPLSFAYYRLQTVDIDGSFEYSNVLIVERLKTEIDVIEMYPNPIVESEVSVLIHSTKEGPVFVDLFDMTGRVIMQDRINLEFGVNRVLLDWETTEGNFYFFTLYNGKERISKKILVSNLD